MSSIGRVLTLLGYKLDRKLGYFKARFCKDRRPANTGADPWSPTTGMLNSLRRRSGNGPRGIVIPGVPSRLAVRSLRESSDHSTLQGDPRGVSLGSPSLHFRQLTEVKRGSRSTVSVRQLQKARLRGIVGALSANEPTGREERVHPRVCLEASTRNLFEAAASTGFSLMTMTLRKAHSTPSDVPLRDPEVRVEASPRLAVLKHIGCPLVRERAGARATSRSAVGPPEVSGERIQRGRLTRADTEGEDPGAGPRAAAGDQTAPIDSAAAAPRKSAETSHARVQTWRSGSSPAADSAQREARAGLPGVATGPRSHGPDSGPRSNRRSNRGRDRSRDLGPGLVISVAYSQQLRCVARRPRDTAGPLDSCGVLGVLGASGGPYSCDVSGASVACTGRIDGELPAGRPTHENSRVPGGLGRPEAGGAHSASTGDDTDRAAGRWRKARAICREHVVQARLAVILFPRPASSLRLLRR
ncbi:hypothetical protein HPB47_024468 [Ixodes persulcatus]|uniref:Uncharacterized protein n=1 Tax=Ixodes persulcatus TaxID=34615 RepID=A0AC60Q5C1_IXOPE|nr:hypothetical protein HPB47_024468 [Ixodes persulcatus]